MAKWNLASAVSCCPDCEGTGWVPATRRPTIDDPYPERRCDCGAEGGPECPVCGYTQVHQGYDCLACETVAALTDDEVGRFDADAFAAAVKEALKVRGRYET